jgi:hypothetical protein
MKGNDQAASIAAGSSWRALDKQRDRRPTYRRAGGLVVLVAGAAFGLTACSGSSSPHVASLGQRSVDGSVSTTTTVPARSPTQLLDEWATCMRSHGDPNQVDPTVDASKVIQITLDTNVGLRGENGACGSYLSAAETALGGGTPPASSDEETALKFAQCMRANGVPTYPDPTTGNNQTLHASSANDLNPASPTFEAASTLCTKKTGYASKFSAGPPPPGSINITMAGGFGGKT